jgi:hypothetical protein
MDDKDFIIKFVGGTEMRFDKGVGFCDPCYLTELGNKDKDERWSRFCDELWKGVDMHSRGKDGVYEVNGVRMLVMATAFGDGCYDVECDLAVTGTTCGVDAGLLCAFPLEHMDKLTKDNIADFRKRPILGQIVADFGGTIRIAEHDFVGDHGLELKTGDVEEELDAEEEEDTE